MATATKAKKTAKTSSKTTAARGDPFIHKLVLNAWMIEQLGVDPLAEHKDAEGRIIPAIRKLSYSILDEDKEGLHDDGRHRFFHELNANWPATAVVVAAQLASYEDNILAHTKALNDRRQARGLRPIVWKYLWGIHLAPLSGFPCFFALDVAVGNR